MVQCPRCGTANTTDATFCGNCGNNLSAAAMPLAIDPAPASEAAPCPKCGAPLNSGTAFCANCRARAVAPAAPAASAPLAQTAAPPPAEGRSGPGKLIAIALIAFLLTLAIGAAGLFWYRNRRAATPTPEQSAAAQPLAPSSSAAEPAPTAAPPQPEQAPAVETPPPQGTNQAPASQPPQRPFQAQSAPPAPVVAAPQPQSAAPTEPAPPPQAQAPPEESAAPAPEPPPQQAAPQPPPARNPVPARPVYNGPQSGWLVWTGKLDKNAALTIDGASASTGSLQGELPGVPVDVTVDVQNIGLTEEPRPSNGFRRLTLHSYAKHSVIRIHWTVRR